MSHSYARMNDIDAIRVLSIQSHVVSGYVGNRAATFPLQLLGYDVDVVNTVQFSNHTGYGYTNGHKTTALELKNVFEGLTTNGLLGYSRILTGYIPGAEALQVVAEQMSQMRKKDPGIVYVLDPVMGDGGKLYVSDDVIPIYKSMLSMATIITPNHFEAQLLSGITISSMSDLHACLRQLHVDHGLPHIVLSSIPLPATLVKSLSLPPPPMAYTDLLPSSLPPWYDAIDLAGDQDEILVCFASSMINGEMKTWSFALPTIRGYFSGVGDLFSAMVLAHFQAQPPSSTPSLPHAVAKALLAVQQVLLQTHLFSLSHASAAGTATPRRFHAPSDDERHNGDIIPSDVELDSAIPTNPNDPKRKAKRMRVRELRVVQERKLLMREDEGWPGSRLQWQDILSE